MNQPTLKHYSFIFEELWKNGIDALRDRIKDIEAGVSLSDIEVILRFRQNTEVIFRHY